MQKIRKNKTEKAIPRLDRDLMPWEREKELLFCCPFCRFNTLEPTDIHYHIIGYHKVLDEFFNDY